MAIVRLLSDFFKVELQTESLVIYWNILPHHLQYHTDHLNAISSEYLKIQILSDTQGFTQLHLISQ